MTHAVSASKLAQLIEGRLLTPDVPYIQARDVSIDSRTIKPGQIFFAVAGENFDGHNFVAAAVEKGAVCVVVQKQLDLSNIGRTSVILVDDTIIALGQFASWYRDQLDAKVIAITGSAGKTTIRNMLYTVLSKFYRCHQSPKSFNNNIGVPLTLLSAQPDDEILLVELGSNAPGEISCLTKLSKPDAAVVSFIGPAHLEGFRTLDNILVEKASIAEGLTANGKLYVNGDQPDLVRYVKDTYNVDIITFGSNTECDVIGTDFSSDGLVGSLMIEGQIMHVPLPGKANLSNALTVWSVCRDLNVRLSDCIDAIKTLKPVSMRLQVQNIGPLTVLNDCYNANPASMENALQCLSAMRKSQSGRLVFIAGTMNELGDQSEALHRQLGQKCTAQGVDLLLASGPMADHIASGARENTQHPIGAQTFADTEQLCDNLHKWIKPDDIILVKASRAARLENAVARLQQLFENQ